jgi:hypothetical protein
MDFLSENFIRIALQGPMIVVERGLKKWISWMHISSHSLEACPDRSGEHFIFSGSPIRKIKKPGEWA